MPKNAEWWWLSAPTNTLKRDYPVKFYMISTTWHAAKIQSLGALELWPLRFSCGLRNSNACTLLWRAAGAFLEEAVIVLAMVISTWPSWCCRLDMLAMLGQFHPICLLSALSMACDRGLCASALASGNGTGRLRLSSLLSFWPVCWGWQNSTCEPWTQSHEHLVELGAGLMIITPPGMWTMSSSLVKPATAFRYLGSSVPLNNNMIRPKEAKPFQGDLDRRSWNRVITCNQNFVLSQQTLQLL